MSRIRVLVVDDAVVIRKILTDALSEDPDIEVVGVAANGRIALQKIPQINPDIITLDVEMPELNGIETLKEVRKLYPKLPVIMFSTLTERGADTTLEALSLGASDYCMKPANVGSVGEARDRVREELAEKIKGFFGKVAHPACPAPREGRSENLKSSIPRIVTPVKRASKKLPVGIIGIGVSTGGPNALAELLPHIPKGLGVPIVCVQHMPPVFTQMLAERLDKTSPITVVEGQEGMQIHPDHMYIAPGDHHMLVVRKGSSHYLKLNQDVSENSCRPAVDPLFRSITKEFGASVLGVILTGMGQDGLLGCEGLKEAGGTVFVQDKASSVVWGMPGYVAEAGLADRVLPLSLIAPEIVKFISYRSGKRIQANAGGVA